jgi:ATP-binding cassette subfamily F protein 3
MSVVRLHNIHKSFGPEVVLDQFELELFAGEIVGMVGANGCGKTTVLRLILGQEPPDMGQVIRQKGLRIGYLPQEPVFDADRTVLEQMHLGLEDLLGMQRRLQSLAERLEQTAHEGREYESLMRDYDRLGHDFESQGGWAFETRIRTTLAGVGLDESLLSAKTSTLSGGQLSRLGLAQVLMKETDLLLLDEPTNHLDLAGTIWLERFLRSFKGAAVVISHDRYLLDRIACKIIEVENRKAKIWRGNYSTFVETRKTVLLQQQREYEARAEMVERTLDFIARNKDQEGMRKTARGRKTRLEKLLKENPDFLDKPSQSKTIDFQFRTGGGRSELVLRCENLGMAFGPVELFRGLTLDLLCGQRLGITGPNGTGKTTLLRLALKRFAPTEGTIRLAPMARIGYLDQQADVLDAGKTVLEEAAALRPDISTERIRGILGTFLFSGDDVFKKTADLSGGQQNRLMLCRLVLTEPDVLILDEPTNHLDIPSRESLEQALIDFPGSILVVSHDRYFLDRVADRLLVIGVDELGELCPGRTELICHERPYSAYAERLTTRAEQSHQGKDDDSVRKPRRSSPSGDKSRAATPPELRAYNKYTIEQIEKMITDLEQQHTQTHDQFGDAKVYQNPATFAELHCQYDRQKEELDRLYRAYELRLR